jgi:hypothetical protein
MVDDAKQTMSSSASTALMHVTKDIHQRITMGDMDECTLPPFRLQRCSCPPESGSPNSAALVLPPPKPDTHTTSLPSTAFSLPSAEP